MSDIINDFSKELEALKLPHTISKGATIQGTVTGVKPGLITIDVGYRADGQITGAEMFVEGDHELPKVGDVIPVYVMNDGAALGFPILSIKQTGGARKWDDLEKAKTSEKIFEATVMEVNTGGAMVALPADIKGFIPASHLDQRRFAGLDRSKFSPKDKNYADAVLQQLQPMVGTKIKLRVLDVDKKKKKVLLSEKLAMQTIAKNSGIEITAEEGVDMEFTAAQESLRAELVSRIKMGDVMEATVMGIANFGLFVNANGIEGLVHISQVSWDKVDSLEARYKVGDKVQVKVISLDPDTKRVGFSIKMLDKDPWEKVPEKYKVGEIVKGEITKITEYGAFVKLEEGIFGLIHNSEIDENSKLKASDVLSEGETLDLKILSISVNDRHFGLSRRAVVAETKEDPAEKSE